MTSAQPRAAVFSWTDRVHQCLNPIAHVFIHRLGRKDGVAYRFEKELDYIDVVAHRRPTNNR